MTASNLRHIFIDGRRVTFDRRDDSVTLFPDDGHRFIGAHRLGYAKGSKRDWTATALNGAERTCDGRTAAANWLIEHTQRERAEVAAAQAETRAAEGIAADQATEMIRGVQPNYRRPQPLDGDPTGQVFFVFVAEEMRDLLLDLRATGDR